MVGPPRHWCCPRCGGLASMPPWVPSLIHRYAQLTFLIQRPVSSRFPVSWHSFDLRGLPYMTSAKKGGVKKYPKSTSKQCTELSPAPLIWHSWGLSKVSYKPNVILTDYFHYKKILFGIKKVSYYPVSYYPVHIIREALNIFSGQRGGGGKKIPNSCGSHKWKPPSESVNWISESEGGTPRF